MKYLLEQGEIQEALDYITSQPTGDVPGIDVHNIVKPLVAAEEGRAKPKPKPKKVEPEAKD